ncbi:hypothetical protein LPB03_01060 [Polaribacter vadi]|uniref:Lipocalin-like domain-containing protein n=1 Tax=Polaribacter vadi TaxID=1774273 RepID=A0A1B8U0Y9_9FLAO|nr:hypothetical protein [Polaribacter vadi]AOW16133.1 hypothetical protein LPB03_01060 [Polaribacter vadi]OBY65541.1 hypothetical protein LPB3_04050 [Polaribacter vadi]
MKRIYSLVLIISTLFFSNCSKDDNELDVRYNTNDLQKLHANSSKKWLVESFFINYESNILSEYNDCYTDDEFTFFDDKKEVQTTLGNSSCFYDNPTDQQATLSYQFYDDIGKIYLNVSRGESFNEKFTTRIFTLELEEISETRMVFASGEYPNYGKTIVFTAVP